MTQLCLLARSFATDTRFGPPKFEPVLVDAAKVGIVIIDMWDKHWCPSATKRATTLAKQIDVVLTSARSLGVQIFHAPSSEACETFYNTAGNPGSDRRREFLNAPTGRGLVKDEPLDQWPGKKQSPMGNILFQDTCEDKVAKGSPWSRQHPWIKIKNPDYVVYENERKRMLAVAKHRGIGHLVYMGVHTNQCVTWTRSTSMLTVKETPDHRITVYLARDLTDATYVVEPGNQKPLYWVHDSGTAAVIGWIEKEGGMKTILSSDLMAPASDYLDAQQHLRGADKQPVGAR